VAVVFAGLAALLFGSSDFVGGYATRRNATLVVVVLSQLAGLLVAATATAVLGIPPAGVQDLGYGALAGLGAAAGLVLLYRGLAGTVVAVVSPVAAVIGAVFPVVFGIAAGERPTVAAWAGMAIAVPAIVLLVREPGARRRHRTRSVHAVPIGNDPNATAAANARDTAQRSGASPSGTVLTPSLRGGLLGAAAGIGFGLSVIAIAQVSADATMWPVSAARVAAVIVLIPLLLIRRTQIRVARGSLLFIVSAGILDMLGTIAFLEASRGTLLSIAAVITSLYPAPTVILGAAVFGEHLTPSRIGGLVLALAGIALISLAPN